MKSIIKEPFFHFILLGGLIFLLYGFLNKDTQHPEGYDIVITPDQQVKMAVQYQKNFGTLPDSTILKNLVAAEIKNEIFYREALRLGLDTDDEIIRRRLKQKYEFIQMDQLTGEEPTEKELKTFFEKNQDQYKTPVTYSFDHHYFSPDKRTDPSKDAIAFMNNGGPSDAFHIPSPLSNQDIDDLRNAFGFQFSEEIKVLDQEKATAVIKSGFGLHVVTLLSKSESVTLPYDEVKPQVYQDFLSQSRNNTNNAEYDRLRDQYDVTVEDL